jgi:hypothetical protein
MATEEEKRTPVFNWETGEFKVDLQGRIVTVTQTQAVEQIIIKAQQTARGVFLIYANVDNEDLDHKYGSDAWDILTRPDLPEAVRIDELKRAISEAIIYDPWVTDVYDIKISRDPEGKTGDPLNPTFTRPPLKETDSVYCTFWVRTVFDEEIQIQGVSLTNG